jgi:calpain-15
MGCGATRLDEDPDIDEHHIAIEKIFDKNIKVDLYKNPNIRLLQSKNYYMNQKPEEGKELDDDLFPPENQSLKGKYELPLAKERIEWKSADKIWGDDISIFGETISENDIKLGMVKDTYFITAIKALIKFPSIIIQLFKTMMLPKDDSGIQIFLKIEGVWTIYIIDNYFPVSKETGETIFCDSPTKNLWAVLLEKAWAKANFGYGNIVQGLTSEVFKAFTPFITIPINVIKEDAESFWESIKVVEKNNCIMTATVTEGTPNIDDVGLSKNYSYIFESIEEKDFEKNKLKLVKMRDPLGVPTWRGLWSPKNEKWTDKAKELFNYYPEKNPEDDQFFISFEDLRKYFRLINILVPMRPCICKCLNIPKEKADGYNILKVKFDKKGIFALGIERQITRFHKDLKVDHDMIENVLFAKIYKEDKKLIYYDACFNEALLTRVEPGEYIFEFNLDYKTLEITDIRPYNIYLLSNINYSIKTLDSDKDLTVMKTIMVPKIESRYKNKSKFKEPFVFFTGNRFYASSYGFFYMKNQTKETKYLKPNFFAKNLKSIEGEIPKALKMEPESKFFFIYNRYKVNLPFQTGVKPNFCRIDDIRNMEIVEPEVPEYAGDAYFREEEYDELEPDYTFEG